LTEQQVLNTKAQYTAFLEGFMQPVAPEPPAPGKKAKRRRRKKNSDAAK